MRKFEQVFKLAESAPSIVLSRQAKKSSTIIVEDDNQTPKGRPFVAGEDFEIRRVIHRQCH